MVDEAGFTVHVGIGDIYQKQLDQDKQLAKMAGTLEELGHAVSMLTSTQTEVGKLRGQLEVLIAQGAGTVHEGRISVLERRMAVVQAFAGLATMVAGGSVAAIITHF